MTLFFRVFALLNVVKRRFHFALKSTPMLLMILPRSDSESHLAVAEGPLELRLIPVLDCSFDSTQFFESRHNILESRINRNPVHAVGCVQHGFR